MRTSRASNAILAGLACLAAAAGTPARADEGAVRFDLAAGTIDSVLPEFARQAGLQIVAPADAERGARLRVAALHGEMAPREALRRLIAGTGLVVASDDGEAIVLQRRPLYASLSAAAGPQDAAVPQSTGTVAGVDADAQSTQADAPASLACSPLLYRGGGPRSEAEGPRLTTLPFRSVRP